LKIEIQIASSEIDPRSDKPTRKLEIQQQAQQLIQKSFAASARELRDWLDLSQLYNRYQMSGSMALQRFDFDMWFRGLELDWEIQQRKLTEWSDKACDFFGLPAVAKFKMQWPMEPEVIFPAATTTADDADNAVAPVAIATGLGWVFGGPVGAAVLGGGSYLLNKTRNPLAIGVDETRLSRVQQAYEQAMQNYLTQLNTLGLNAIAQYEREVRSTLYTELKAEPSAPDPAEYRVDLLRRMLADLAQN
jgi:hypothetical protein